MDKKQFIGVFDSGIGGLNVLNNLVEDFPNENFLYVGDNLNVPYGVKTTKRLSVSTCPHLKTVVIPNTVEFVDFRTLYDNANLNKVIISGSVQNFINGTFYSSPKVTSFMYDGTKGGEKVDASEEDREWR